MKSKRNDPGREAQKQREIQMKIDDADRAETEKKKEGAMQAGARTYPAPPLPKQHHPKPGEEWKIDPPPMYDAPFWVARKSSTARWL